MKTLRIYPNGAWMVEDHDVAANNIHFGPGMHSAQTDAQVQVQIDFYRAMGVRIVDLRAQEVA